MVVGLNENEVRWTGHGALESKVQPSAYSNDIGK
jgi:hypothetical protein